MLRQNANSQYDAESSSFIFKRIKEPKTGASRVLVQNKEYKYQHVPYLRDFQFKPCYLPEDFERYAEQIRDFKVRKDDVWVLSFPKTGSTLLCSIVSQLTQGFDFSDDVASCRHKHSFDRIYHNRPGAGKTYSHKIEHLKRMDSAPSQRIMKSHLPPHLLPVDLWRVLPKMIYIARNPKDTAISQYHMLSNIYKDISRTFISKEDFLDAFPNGTTPFGPFDTHVLSFCQLRNLDNFLFLTYEELSADRLKSVKKIAQFLECEYSDEDLEKLAETTSFEKMKQINAKIPTNLTVETRFV